MLPGIEYIKTLLNGVMLRLRRVEKDAAEAKEKASQVEQTDWNEADQNALGYLKNKPLDLARYKVVNFVYGNMGRWTLDIKPRDIISFIKSGGYVIAKDATNVIYNVFVESEDPIRLVFYMVRADSGLFEFYVWDSEDDYAFPSSRVSQFLSVGSVGHLRYSDSGEVTSSSGFLKSTRSFSNASNLSMRLYLGSDHTGEAYVLAELPNSLTTAGLKFEFSNGQVEVPLVDYNANDFPEVSLKYILLHVTAIDKTLTHVRDVFYGEDLNSLTHVSVDKIINNTTSISGSYLKLIMTNSRYDHSSFNKITTLNATVYIL